MRGLLIEVASLVAGAGSRARGLQERQSAGSAGMALGLSCPAARKLCPL